MASQRQLPTIRAELPRIPPTLPVYEVRAASLEERAGAVEYFQGQMRMDKPFQTRIEESIRYIGETGEIEFYRPSGALWVRDFTAAREFKDERRSWDSEVIRTEEGTVVVLNRDVQEHLVHTTQAMFEKTRLYSDHAYFADVVLDQIHVHSPDGRKAVFPGEATVRFLYRFDDIPVAEPGAKSYAYFHGAERMAGAYHAWRDVIGDHKVRSMTAEAALAYWAGRDRQVMSSLKRGQVVEITAAELVYYTMPPSKFQDFVFPALRITGFIFDGENRDEGQEFVRFCHALAPETYARAGIFADTLMIRP